MHVPMSGEVHNATVHKPESGMSSSKWVVHREIYHSKNLIADLPYCRKMQML